MGIPGSLFSFSNVTIVHRGACIEGRASKGEAMNADFKYRLGGVACLIGSVVLGWWGIWQPLQLAQAHAPEVKYSIKIFVLVPALLVFGLFFLIGGARWQYRNVETKRLTAAGWGLMAATLAISGLAFWWLQNMFTALGYTSG